MKNSALALFFIASLALASCHHCSTCPMIQEGKKYKKLKRQAVRIERKMNKQVKNQMKG